MNKTNKPVHEQTDTIITDSGELLEVINTKTHPVGTEPPYYKMYCDFVDDISTLFQLGNAEKLVFLSIARNMSYNNAVFLVKPTKRIIMQETGIKTLNTLNKAIDGLFKKGFLIRQGRGVYTVNPNYVGKGKWEDIKALRLVIDYGKNGRNVVVQKVNGNIIELAEVLEKTPEQSRREEFEKRQQTLPFDDTEK